MRQRESSAVAAKTEGGMITAGMSRDMWLAALADAPPTRKWCSLCQTMKPTREFFPSERRQKSRCRECERTRQARWRAQNKDRRLEYSSRYRDMNRERMRQYDREYRERNRERLNQYAKEYRAANLERLRMLDRERKRRSRKH